MADITTDLLRAMLSMTGRVAFPVDFIANTVALGGAGEKQIQAYNMCDGSRGQAEIAKTLGLDQGNFSRTVGRWIEAGIVFRIGEGREAKLLHAYPLPKETKKKAAK